MKKFKIGLPVLALVLAVAASAFTTTTLDVNRWHFMSNQLSDAKVASEYEPATGSETCGGTSLPCIIEVPDDPNIDDEQELQAYLNSFSSDQDVLASAAERKN
jgi:hypothetical protein